MALGGRRLQSVHCKLFQGWHLRRGFGSIASSGTALALRSTDEGCTYRGAALEATQLCGRSVHPAAFFLDLAQERGYEQRQFQRFRSFRVPS